MLPKQSRITPIALALSLVTFPVAAQQPPAPDQALQPVGNMAVSFNPLGFMQFGPLLNGEYAIGDDLAANVHLRFVPLGVLSWVMHSDPDGLDELRGIGFGGGLLRFFGEERSRPYVGALLEFAVTKAGYAQNQDWEWWEDTQSYIFIANGGYRFRFDNGLFLNTGVFLGSAFSNWDWSYTNPSLAPGNVVGRSGDSRVPFGMLELTFGYEF